MNSVTVREKRDVEQVVTTRLLRVSAVLHGIVTGLVFGLGIFIATNWLVLKGGRVVGPHLALLGNSSSGIGSRLPAASSGSATALSSGFCSGSGSPVSTISSSTAEEPAPAPPGDTDCAGGVLALVPLPEGDREEPPISETAGAVDSRTARRRHPCRASM